MADQNSPTKARLVILDKATKDPQDIKPGQEALEVDFNPTTLKLTYANKTDGGKQAKPSESQFVGSLDATLAVDLIFDSTQPRKEGAAGEDVRKKTKRIFQLLLPKDPKKPKSAPPIVRFEWGSFLFEGMLKSINETLEYFSTEGIPLRSTVAITMTTTTDLMLFNDTIKKKTPADFARTPPGTQPQTQIPPGDSLQKAAGRSGNSSDWRSIAAANNIDNPLRPPVGQPLNMNATASTGGGLGASFGASFSASAGAGADASLSAGASASAQAGFSAGIGGGVGFSAGASAGASAGISAGASAGFGANVGFGASAGASVSAGASFGGGVSAGASAGFSASASATADFGGGASFTAGADSEFRVKTRG